MRRRIGGFLLEKNGYEESAGVLIMRKQPQTFVQLVADGLIN